GAAPGLAPENGHQRHDSSSAHHETEGSEEHAPQGLRVSREAQARADGAEHALGGENGRNSLSPPREEHTDDPEKRQGVEHEDDARPRRRHDESSERGTERSSDV